VLERHDGASGGSGGSGAVQPAAYAQLVLSLSARPAVADIIKAEGWLRRLLSGLVSRVDAVGDEVPAGEHAGKLHSLFADLFLTAVSLQTAPPPAPHTNPHPSPPTGPAAPHAAAPLAPF